MLGKGKAKAQVPTHGRAVSSEESSPGSDNLMDQTSLPVAGISDGWDHAIPGLLSYACSLLPSNSKLHAKTWKMGSKGKSSALLICYSS